MRRRHRRLTRAFWTVGIAAATLVAPLSPQAALANHYTLCGPQADQYAPTAQSLSLSDTTIDVSNGSQQLTVTIDASDQDLSSNSGVRAIEVQLESPVGGLVTHLALVSGTPTDGTWTGAFTIPTTSVSGDWHVRLVGVRDRSYNETYYIREGKYPQSPTDPRIQPGWTDDFTVTGTATAPTHHPGTITALSFTPTTVNTHNGPVSVTAKAQFSGPQPTSARLWLRGHHSTGRQFFMKPKLHEHANGQWARSFTIRQWTGKVAVHSGVELGYADNVHPTHKFIAPSHMHGAGLSPTFHIDGVPDVTKPTVHDFTFTPDAIDTTSHSQSLSVSATVSDRQSGVNRVYVDFFHHPRTRFGGFGAGLQLTHQHGNVWSGSTTIYKCLGMLKPWQADVYAFDTANGRRHLGPKALAAGGFPTTLTVTSGPPGDAEAPGISASSASGIDHSITLDFSEGVKGVSTDTLAVYEDKKSPSRFATTIPVNGVTCSDGMTTVNCDGSGGFATSATLDVPDLIGNHHYVIYTDPNPAVATISDAAGNIMGNGGGTTVKVS